MTFSIKVYSSLNEKKILYSRVHLKSLRQFTTWEVLWLIMEYYQERFFFRLDNTIFHWLFSLFHICISKYK